MWAQHLEMVHSPLSMPATISDKLLISRVIHLSLDTCRTRSDDGFNSKHWYFGYCIFSLQQLHKYIWNPKRVTRQRKSHATRRSFTCVHVLGFSLFPPNTHGLCAHYSQRVLLLLLPLLLCVDVSTSDRTHTPAKKKHRNSTYPIHVAACVLTIAMLHGIPRVITRSRPANVRHTPWVICCLCRSTQPRTTWWIN